MQTGDIAHRYDCGFLWGHSETGQFEQTANEGMIKAVKTPIMVEGTLPEARMQAPLIGEHTVEVLKEYGYSDSDIEGFISNGIVMQHRV